MTREPSPDGVLIVDKPPGMTSHDVVDEIRRRLRTKKVGHGGTLDPDATGVLVIGVGRVTRLLSFNQSAPKRYRARAKFGIATTTQDASGEVVATKQPTFERAQLEVELKNLTGDIEQIPPMVSAVKIGGERLYKAARRGEEVERPARPVTVYSFELVDFDAGAHEATFEVECSGGTYVRTLVHDVGEALGCGAHLTSLRRTGAGRFDESEAIPLDAVDESHLRPPADAVRDLPRLDLDDDDATSVTHGRSLELTEVARGVLDEGDFVALFGADRLLAIYRRTGDALTPDRVLAA